MGDSTLAIPFSCEVEPIAPLICFTSTVIDDRGIIDASIDNDQYQKERVLVKLKSDLNVSRLNKIHEYLWLAGRPTRARPLHQQYMMGRQLVITEKADLHLTWLDARIFIKPIPRLLLHRATWSTTICKDDGLYKDACGFLLSYVALIQYESDLKIALDVGLVPSTVDWTIWCKIANELLNNLDTMAALTTINKRYHYGELRINRLNAIYRIRLGKVFRGYFFGYRQYHEFFGRNFAWLLTFFIYVTLILTAMQVGLATPELMISDPFRQASKVFAVFSIIVPAAASVVMLALGGILFLDNLRATLQFKKENRGRSNKEAATASSITRDQGGVISHVRC